MCYRNITRSLLNKAVHVTVLFARDKIDFITVKLHFNTAAEYVIKLQLKAFGHKNAKE